jgi:hypothetical protein
MFLCLAAKSSHVGVGVIGIAYPLHCPMARSYQRRGHGHPPGAVMSCHYSRRWRLSGDVNLPVLGYLVES